ncbi:MAG: OsmC family protein [Candidatus Nanohaloarchaeota archaeon QJJ-9]|nr:OsmC family protein [Candidatus Nanohaloarchaeota archaeon QJJ-9]
MGDKLPIKIESKAQTHTELDVSVRDHSLKVDEPENFGGKDKAPNPLEYMFTALASCLNVTAHQVAEEHEVEIDSLEIDIEGELDLAGFMGEDERAGFQEVNVEARIETNADEETEQKILEEAEDRCPVSDNIQHKTDLKLEKN